MEPLKVKNSKSIGNPSNEAAHDVKFVCRSTDFVSWPLCEHLKDLGSNWLRHSTFVWDRWGHWWWKIPILLESHPVRQLMTWNLCVGAQILRHDPSVSTSKTSDPTKWCMPHLSETDEAIDGEKFQFYQNHTQWGCSWREIWVPKCKFCVMTPPRAPWRPWIHLIGRWHIVMS